MEFSNCLSGDGDLDLHGCKRMEAVKDFINDYNDRIDNHDISPYKVVHGYGSTGRGGGVISTALKTYLNKYPEAVEYISHKECLVIIPRRPLPTFQEYLKIQLLEYCGSPKTRSKIDNKFHGWGSPEITSSLRILIKEGRLKKIPKGKVYVYKRIEQ